MNEFKNETECGIYTTRFIMSWVREGGTFSRRGIGYDEFREWLQTLIIDGNPLSENDVDHIVFMAQNGKMELENSAKMFLKKLETE